MNLDQALLMQPGTLVFVTIRRPNYNPNIFAAVFQRVVAATPGQKNIAEVEITYDDSGLSDWHPTERVHATRKDAKTDMRWLIDKEIEKLAQERGTWV